MTLAEEGDVVPRGPVLVFIQLSQTLTEILHDPVASSGRYFSSRHARAGGDREICSVPARIGAWVMHDLARCAWDALDAVDRIHVCETLEILAELVLCAVFAEWATAAEGVELDP
jgi:hypothetical protein